MIWWSRSGKGGLGNEWCIVAVLGYIQVVDMVDGCGAVLTSLL